MFVTVKFKSKFGDEFKGREYTYRTGMDLVPGDIVNAPTSKGVSSALVCEVNVPESKIDERFIGSLREITEYCIAEPVKPDEPYDDPFADIFPGVSDDE